MNKAQPDEIWSRLETKGKNPRLIRNLTIIHEICREITNGAPPRDFSTAYVGRISQMRSGPSLNTLYSPKGKHFRHLIDDWAKHDVSFAKKVIVKSPVLEATPGVMSKIEDPAVRSFVGLLSAENRRLRAEIIALKALSGGTPVIDMRPLASQSAFKLSGNSVPLTDDERESLVNATSINWLKANRLKEGIRGELLNGDGGVVLSRGALTGIRKLLMVESPALNL